MRYINLHFTYLLRLRWLGHTIRMDDRHITHRALYWEVPGFKRGPGRPRTNWRGIVKKDLQGMGLTWEEAEVAALNGQEWRRSVAQYVHVDVGGIKSSQRGRSGPLHMP